MKHVRLYALPILISVISLLIEMGGDAGRALFQYENSAMTSHEYWRFLSGHLTHQSWMHYILNVAGLFGIWVSYGAVLNTRLWVGAFLICAIGSSLGFYFFVPDLSSYVGMSGVLHGLLSAALIYKMATDWQGPERRMAWEDIILIVGLAGKILYEYIYGFTPFTPQIAGGNVVVEAHLYGTLLGVFYGILIWARHNGRVT